LVRKLRKTTVFVTHDVREALLVGDQIGLLAGGRLEELLPAADFRAAKSAEARAFLAVLEE
jgi:ABC-type proline/glycine betaine transport system ATPase subunit